LRKCLWQRSVVDANIACILDSRSGRRGTSVGLPSQIVSAATLYRGLHLSQRRCG